MPDPVLVPAATLGSLDRADLAVALRPLWEDAGPLVDRLVGREVETWRALIALAEAEILTMDDPDRRSLLNAHPRIGEQPTTLETRSALSYDEQGGDVGATAEILSRLEVLNGRYEQRFGFPFVEWVAGRSRQEMVAIMEARLVRDPRSELDAGCQALVAIALDRLRRIGAEDVKGV